MKMKEDKKTQDIKKTDWRDIIIWILIVLGFILLIASFFKGG